MNRSFHPDDWPAWLAEVELLLGRAITAGVDVDRLYGAYMDDVAPGFCAWYMRGHDGEPAPERPLKPVRPRYRLAPWERWVIPVYGLGMLAALAWGVVAVINHVVGR